MKKFKILAALMMFCLLFVAGCGGVNGNIKLQATTLSAADFFNSSIMGLASVRQAGQEQISVNSNAETLSNYQNLVAFASAPLTNQYSIISVFDFCVELLNAEGSAGVNQKIYEYSDGVSSQRMIVVVNCVRDTKYTAIIYLADGGTEFKDLTDSNIVHDATYIVSINKNTGLFEYSGSATNNNGTTATSGTILYEANVGKLNMVNNLTLDGTNVVCNANFYNYKNGILGGRITMLRQSSTALGMNIIQEFLLKDYQKKLKIGTYANDEFFVDLTNTTEESIAISNEGDTSGFIIEADSQAESGIVTTSHQVYGTFN